MARHEGRRRIERWDAEPIRDLIGRCPLCTGLDALAVGFPGAVIYRRSKTSLTMRCDVCGLQWTMTWAKVRQAAEHHARVHPDGAGGWGGAVLEWIDKHCTVERHGVPVDR